MAIDKYVMFKACDTSNNMKNLLFLYLSNK